MKNIILFTLLLIPFLSIGQTKKGHIWYEDEGNTFSFGRNVLLRTSAANYDTLTNVVSGTVVFDTVTAVAMFYDGSDWNEYAGADGADGADGVDGESFQILDQLESATLSFGQDTIWTVTVPSASTPSNGISYGFSTSGLIDFTATVDTVLFWFDLGCESEGYDFVFNIDSLRVTGDKWFLFEAMITRGASESSFNCSASISFANSGGIGTHGTLAKQATSYIANTLIVNDCSWTADDINAIFGCTQFNNYLAITPLNGNFVKWE